MFASFYLAKYRPETQCYETDHPNRDGYTWEDLIKWVDQMRNDRSIISKFRLMAMHRSIAQMSVSYKKTKMLANYRARNRDLWPATERDYYMQKEQSKLDAWMEMQHDENVLDREDFEQQHANLSETETQNLAKKFLDLDAVLPNLQNCLGTNRAIGSNHFMRQTRGTVGFSLDLDVMNHAEKAKEIASITNSFVNDLLVTSRSKALELKNRNAEGRRYIAKLRSAQDKKLTAGQDEIISLVGKYLFGGETSTSMPPIMLVTGAA